MRIPLVLGAEDLVHEDVQAALLRPLERYLDTEPGTGVNSETYGEATLVEAVWAVNERLAGFMIPSRMLESLPTWEEACGLRPTDADSDAQRRGAVGAAFRGISGNAPPDIADAIAAAAGQAYVDTLRCDPADDVTYWPGINPGPPGFEWSSNRAIVGAKLTSDGQSLRQYRAAQAAVARTLDRMLPARMGYRVGSGDGFLAGVGIVGETFL